MDRIDLYEPSFFNYNCRKKDGRNVFVSTPFESTPDYIKKMWYEGLCSPDELQRVLHSKNAQDYLLRVAVDSISVEPRLCRVIRKHKQNLGEKWSIEKFLNPIAQGYKNFYTHLPAKLQTKVHGIATGCILSDNMNGEIFSSPYGICSIINYSLKYFVEFAYLAIRTFETEIPVDVKIRSMIIAIRIGLRKEALDFDLDRRGIIPPEIKKEMRVPFPYISTFIAGHEYGHFINGNFNNLNSPNNYRLRAEFNDIYDPRKQSFDYNSSQKEEFKADLCALNLPHFSDEYYYFYYHYTMLWFVMLAIEEVAENCIFPPMGYQKHPGAKARYQNILENAKHPIFFSEEKELYTKTLPDIVNTWEKFIQEEVSCNIQEFETYGSAYLAEPNTQWRGKELIDHIDY